MQELNLRILYFMQSYLVGDVGQKKMLWVMRGIQTKGTNTHIFKTLHCQRYIAAA